MRIITSSSIRDIESVRELHDHKVTALNEQKIRVYAADEKGAGGANHHYIINAINEAETSDSIDELIAVVEVEFQNGPLNETGCNGITDQALLAIVIDRLRGFQAGEYACRENEQALIHLEEALRWTGKRAASRRVRGVEGTHQK